MSKISEKGRDKGKGNASLDAGYWMAVIVGPVCLS